VAVVLIGSLGYALKVSSVMQRKDSDVYIGAAVVTAVVAGLAFVLKASIFFRIVAVGLWVGIALRLWQTKVGFCMLLGACMFPPLILLYFVQPPSSVVRSD
jgi:hypothetical protein